MSSPKAIKRKGDDVENALFGETSSKKSCEDKNELKSEKNKEECAYWKLQEKLEKKSGCSYWGNGWRMKLCVCQSCKVKST